MFMKKLTKSQAKVFDFLKESIADGITPSVREICLATGLSSTSTVHSHLKSLEELGYITRTTGLNRSIRIVGEEKHHRFQLLARLLQVFLFLLLRIFLDMYLFLKVNAKDESFLHLMLLAKV